ncbi:lactate utilization protein C [Amycolatopsis sp. A1MSW2902]|uniref:LutC/YkgG family protein n=1 Tax=Amycolatopsis sp. A1MSW2902 TaxID=687413 RepID=UPI00307E6BDD
MSAREQTLGRARRALSDVTIEDPIVDVPIDRPRQSSGRSPEQIVDLFAERVADYRAGVAKATTPHVASAVSRALQNAAAGGNTVLRVVVPPGFPVEYLPDSIEVVTDGPDVPVAVLDRCDGVVTTAAVGIAETGTIVLDHGPGQGRRAATLVPDVHVCVIEEARVIAGIPESVSVLDPRRPQTWISGPSATSDIELDRVEGVHGPRTLQVVIVTAEG